jgi:hypothetical protein
VLGLIETLAKQIETTVGALVDGEKGLGLLFQRPAQIVPTRVWFGPVVLIPVPSSFQALIEVRSPR